MRGGKTVQKDPHIPVITYMCSVGKMEVLMVRILT